MSYFTELHPNKNEIKLRLNLSKYATKSKLKNETYKSKKDDLAELKSEIDKLEIDKLKPVPVNLSKLCNVVKMLLNSMCIIQIKKAQIKKIEDVVEKKQMLGN